MLTEAKPGLTRREFLKFSGAALGGLAVPKVERLLAAEVSSHPAWFNTAAKEVRGLNIVTPKSFGKHFISRAKEIALKPEIRKRDRMFNQIATPVGDLKDRGLDFDLRNKDPLKKDQGLGFKIKDLENLKTQKNIESKLADTFLQEGDDGRSRGWAIVEAGNLDKALLAYVDAHLELQGKDPSDPSVQEERKSLFEKKAYGDLAIRPKENDGKWWTIGENFSTSETYLGAPGVAGNQGETLGRVSFQENVEIPGNGIEEESFNRKDSRNPVLLTAVSEVTNDKHLRIEAYSLANTPDPLNPKWEALLGDKDTFITNGSPTGIDGGRFVPKGVKYEEPSDDDVDKDEIKGEIPSSTPTPEPGPVPTPEPTPKPKKEKGNNGHGNDGDKCDSSNPGKKPQCEDDDTDDDGLPPGQQDTGGPPGRNK